MPLGVTFRVKEMRQSASRFFDREFSKEGRRSHAESSHFSVSHLNSVIWVVQQSSIKVEKMQTSCMNFETENSWIAYDIVRRDSGLGGKDHHRGRTI